VPGKATPLFLVYGAEALDGLVCRIVERCPPTEEDFLSYEALGRRYGQRDFFKGTGVSMHTSSAASWRIARLFRVGGAVATLDIRETAVVWAHTGGRDHITVWAPASTLLGCVVQCESHE
jgi:hypothetical protein